MTKILLVIIICIHAFILTKLIFFPYPELFIYPYLTNQGLAPYSQIFDQHFPGLMFLPVNFDNLGMTTPEVARIWSIAIVLIIHLMLFFIAVEIFRNKTKALLVNVLFLIWQPFFEGWVLWIDSFLPLILLPAFYFLYKRKIFLTGLFLGIGIIWKQTTIPLAVLVLIYIFWETRNLKISLKYLTGLFIPVGFVIVYLISIGVFADFWFWTVVFNLTTFAKFGIKAPFFTGLVRVAAVYSPVLLLPFIKDLKKLAVILFIFILGSLSGDFARFDFVHFQPSLPFVLLATAAVFSKIWNFKLMRFGILGYAAVAIWWQSIFYQGHILDKVMFFDNETYQIAQKIRQNSLPKEEIFLLGPVPHLYQLSGTIPAGKIFVFQFPWFLMETEDRFLKALEISPPKLILRDRTVVIEGQPITEYALRLQAYIDKNYVVFDNIGVTEFLKRRDLR